MKQATEPWNIGHTAHAMLRSCGGNAMAHNDDNYTITSINYASITPCISQQ